ncbi:MAG: TonB-dependent receptor [Acidobacteriota bacterium]
MRAFVLTVLIGGLLTSVAFGQSSGTVRGVITLEDTGKPLHNIQVTILQTRRTVMTGEDGVYEFKDVPPGHYDIATHLDRVPDVVQPLQVIAGQIAQLDFLIRLRLVRDQVTVTATGSSETSFNSIQSVAALNAIEISEKNAISLGELLDHELGVSKRSFGPGSSRPVIRGFDGDRVLVLQDGMRIGSLGSQSGDHGEPIDPLTVDRVEIVKGPATLLYGSNGIGGVVNAISEHSGAHEGLRGFATTLGSTNNYQSGGSAGIEFGTKQWSLWGNGGGQRANDYNTPQGRVTNSFARNGNGAGGVGYFPGKGFFSADYSYDWRRYGIPYDPENPDEIVNLKMRRHGVHLRGGARELDSYISGLELSLQYNDYQHEEINSENDQVQTTFKNKMWVYRTVFDQKKEGIHSGSFGFAGFHRDFKTVGAEALAPPTTQNNFAVYGLQKFDFKRAVLQLGGRVEYNSYKPTELRDRSFTGFSGGIGFRVPLWEGGAFVANYSHSFRAPSLEELYNNGPHPGNAVFEIGDSDLKRESGDGIDLAVRHSSSRFNSEVNYFYYHLRDFIFLAPTGDEEEGLPVAVYEQGTSRYTGIEAKFDVALHSSLWLRTGLDYVNAELKETGTPIPRIPPLRGRVGLEAVFKSFRISPELILARDQGRVFPLETRTAGYATFGLSGSYTYAKQHVAHVISVNGFNLGDRLYRNHLSFIKDFAPEIGRGLRLAYTIRFF